jgi:hypothetical protein
MPEYKLSVIVAGDAKSLESELNKANSAVSQFADQSANLAGFKSGLSSVGAQMAGMSVQARTAQSAVTTMGMGSGRRPASSAP